MPNVTISVPDNLKSDMDKLLEVNWSEVSRKAIAKYIDERSNPAPKVDLDLREARIDYFSFRTGLPALVMPLKIHNMMESDIVVDRILYTVSFSDSNKIYPVGSDSDLYKKAIGSSSVGETQLIQELLEQRIRPLAKVFSSTFSCAVRCTLFAEGFKNPYDCELRTKIPIDEWKEVVDRVLQIPKIIRKAHSGINLE